MFDREDICAEKPDCTKCTHAIRCIAEGESPRWVNGDWARFRHDSDMGYLCPEAGYEDEYYSPT